jgi:hypothetical protein
MNRVLIVLASTVVVGCGGSSALKTEPLTAEQQKAFAEEQKKIEQEESGGHGTGVKKKSR